MKWIVALILSVFFVVPAMAEVNITIDLSEQTMLVSVPEIDGHVVWDVSTGKKGKSTPTGYYQPYLLKTMHYSSKYNNAPMPYSIFFKGGYAIHATDAVGRLGSRASHGCIRLHPDHARRLFKLVSRYGKENTHIDIVP